MNRATKEQGSPKLQYDSKYFPLPTKPADCIVNGYNSLISSEIQFLGQFEKYKLIA